MANFSNKLLGLVGAVAAFTGMAYGQISCAPGTGTPLNTAAGPQYVRAEGQTELLPVLNLTCTASAVASLNATLYISPSLTITSKLLSSSTGATEAIASTNDAPGTYYYGTITGSSVVFTGIVTSATTTTISFKNIRVNATAVPAVSGAPPSPISAQAFVSGTNVAPGATNTPQVAFAIAGLNATKIYNDTTYAKAGVVNGTLGVCNSISAQNSTPASTPQFAIQVNEGFSSAFKTAVDEASQQAVTVSGVSNTVNSGTRLKVVFNNVPAGLQIYMPTSVTSTTGGGIIQLVSSETGAQSIVSPITGQSNISSLPPVAQIALSGTTATAIYEETTDNTGVVDQYGIYVWYIASSNTLAASATAETVSVSFAPITAATTVPSFAVGASTSALTLNTFATCTTSLLFPFVTNAAGFETGVAISNTTKDPFTSGGAKPQAGTCTLNFYGQGGTNPTAGLAPNTNSGSGDGAGMPYQAGETYSFTLTSALSTISATNPATFTGYMIAQCNFQDAHGFAYITYGFPGTSSDTMGYLASVLARGSTNPETLGN